MNTLCSSLQDNLLSMHMCGRNGSPLAYAKGLRMCSFSGAANHESQTARCEIWKKSSREAESTFLQCSMTGAGARQSGGPHSVWWCKTAAAPPPPGPATPAASPSPSGAPPRPDSACWPGSPGRAGGTAGPGTAPLASWCPQCTYTRMDCFGITQRAWLDLMKVSVVNEIWPSNADSMRNVKVWG